VDLWKELLDPSGALDFRSELAHQYAPNDQLVLMSWQIPLRFIPRTELMLNRSMFDMLECHDQQKHCPPSFVALEVDPTGSGDDTWRGVRLPPKSGSTRLSRRLVIVAEQASGGTRLHVRSRSILPLPGWMLPTRLIMLIMKDLSAAIYTALLEVGWDRDDGIKQQFARRMEQESDFYAHCDRRIVQLRAQQSWQPHVPQPTLPPCPTGKCEREGCPFQKHSRASNNGGTHCCRRCKELTSGGSSQWLSGKHGPACQRRKHDIEA